MRRRAQEGILDKEDVVNENIKLFETKFHSFRYLESVVVTLVNWMINPQFYGSNHPQQGSNLDSRQMAFCELNAGRFCHCLVAFVSWMLGWASELVGCLLGTGKP